jgi:hypothetical protein
MKPSLSLFPLTAALLLANEFVVSSFASSPPPIPMNQLGAVAGKQYQGDGLSVRATATGAELRCAFQRLEGEVTAEGLWLRSTADNSSGERFRVRAVAVGREFGDQHADWFGVTPSGGPGRVNAEFRTMGLGNLFPFAEAVSLPGAGLVNVTDQVAQFLRPGVTEEYSVSVDGVRQDFLIAQPPIGTGELRLELEITGASVKPLGTGARLTLPDSGRQLAYHRLHVTDATGRELPAQMEVAAEMPAATKLAVLVDDANAVYPVRIDPTFSDANWVSMGELPGADGPVYAIATDGSGNLYCGGHFSAIGNTRSAYIAKWDGNNWTQLGLGLNGRVNALVVSGGDVYAGGAFTTAGGVTANLIAKWDGNTWSALGTGIENWGVSVEALAVSGSNVYVGGSFTSSATRNIAKWDGASWANLGGGLNNGVQALALSGNDLYAGGWFTVATNTGGLPVTVNRIARWDGTNWSALGVGMDHTVWAIGFLGGELYAGGSFRRVTNSSGEIIVANCIAKWSGNNWSALGEGMNSSVHALMSVGDDLYVGGFFSYGTNNGGAPVTLNMVAKWDGTIWTGLADGINGGVTEGVYTLTEVSNAVYAGGVFSMAGGNAAKNLAKWDGGNWVALTDDLGVNSYVHSLAVSADKLYVGGDFSTAGNLAANHIAQWDGSNWSPLGLGIAGSGAVWVSALAASGNILYAGGHFAAAGGVAATNIARWDGTNWAAMGSGVGGDVLALVASNNGVYAGGVFLAAGGNAASRIAKWDGTNWSPLGSGVNGTVHALALVGTNLYAGGSFTMAGGKAANRIAKWDGTTWSSLGTGMNTTVRAIAASHSDLYAGGSFVAADNLQANYVARWNGNGWSSLGSGLNSTVQALALVGDDLYVGGQFLNAGGASASRIAKWNGNSWFQLGSGLDLSVWALAVSDNKLYAGGYFTTAGGKPSAHVAKAIISLAQGKFSEFMYSPVTGFSCTFIDASIGQPYRIQTSPSLVGPWTDFTNFVYAGPVVISDPAPLVGTNKFFRAVTP